MTHSKFIPDTGEDAPDEDILAVYGRQDAVTSDLEQMAEKRCKFEPWHHPVKQIVRERQLAALTAKLLGERPKGASRILRYFTLPGADLLDIRVLADVCRPLDIKIEYFGFDSGSRNSAEEADANTGAPQHTDASWVAAESALLQAGRITPDAVIYADRLEDIALPNSHAAMQLNQRGPFDVINIDACDHLAYCPKGRKHNTFNALEALLKHQMGARAPWLLFITTRVEPGLLGNPGIKFNDAIMQNLRISKSSFGAYLAECLEADETKLLTELASVWGTHDTRFLKLYSVGLGKFLLQFFCAQPNLPANVELASVYAYRVHNEHPDMLALAFRVTPDAPRVFAPNIGGAAIVPELEPVRAEYVAKQAMKLQDLDRALESQNILTEAVNGTKALLQSANYDIPKWREWLADHKVRPLVLTEHV